MKKGFLTGFVLFATFMILLAASTNFDRLVLGSGNYGTDPNTTADITFQNDEYISNTTDGELILGSATLDLLSTVVGQDSFATTAESDTVTISGATSSDLYFVNARGGSVDQQDVLQVEALTGKLVVHRLASGASGLKYNYLRLK